jgi:hypothetical protein
MKQTWKRHGVGALVTCAFAVLVPMGIASGQQTIYVNCPFGSLTAGTATARTVTAGVDAVTPGGAVMISGACPEGLMINKPLTLQARGSGIALIGPDVGEDTPPSPRVVASVRLAATDEPARVDNPACVTGELILAYVVRELIVAVMDHFIGYPVLDTVTGVSPEASNWLNERLGLNDGRSQCANMCGIVSPSQRVKVCEVDSQFGRHCFAPNAPSAASGHPNGHDGPQPYSFTGPITRAASPSGRSEVVCTNVKHWSHTLRRRFTLEVEP